LYSYLENFIRSSGS